jgi:hypothetical protein
MSSTDTEILDQITTLLSSRNAEKTPAKQTYRIYYREAADGYVIFDMLTRKFICDTEDSGYVERKYAEEALKKFLKEDGNDFYDEHGNKIPAIKDVKHE